VEKYLAQQATPAEIAEFHALVQNAGNDNALREALAASWQQFSTDEQMPQQQADALFNNIVTTAEGLHHRPAKLLSMTKWSRLVAAAIILILTGAGLYLYFNAGNKDNSKAIPVIADIKPPASVNAILTLANGRQIELNKTANGNLATENNATITKLADGQIVYNKNADAANAPIAYNTLTVPRGSQVVSIVLADGSKVWLNAASSIRYPAAFTGKERTIEMTGEAYFEVAPLTPKGGSNKIPFIVMIRDRGKVEVLGTHFNIKAYNDEPEIQTTLLEGKVKMSSIVSGQEEILKPGEQISLSQSSQISQPIPVQTDDVVAWKNGRIEFGGNTIEPIMQQIARWYDVQIEYRGAKPTDNFMGGTSRQANVSEILKILEQTRAVRFHIDNKKIIVSKP